MQIDPCFVAISVLAIRPNVAFNCVLRSQKSHKACNKQILDSNRMRLPSVGAIVFAAGASLAKLCSGCAE